MRVGERNDRTKKGSSEYVWALREENFDVKQGEVLGKVRRNGAGKSSREKILSWSASLARSPASLEKLLRISRWNLKVSRKISRR